jgi:hypothetical protein
MAKHRSFKLEKFIEMVDDDLLKAYFVKKGLTIPSDMNFDAESVEGLLDSIKDEKKSSDIEEELHCINDIADRARGYLERAKNDYHIQVAEDETSETTAMKVFLHSDEAFSLAFDFYLYVIYSEKLSHHKFDKCECDFSKAKVDRFKSAVEQHFKDSGKSENCNIRERVDGDKHIILIARGDFMKSHLVFEEGKVHIRSFRPAKEDMLVFDKKSSILSINTSGWNDIDKKTYIEIFGTTILGLDKIDEKTIKSTLVILDPIKDGSFNYKGKGDVESVHLTEVRVKYSGSKTIKVMINCGDVMQAFSELKLSPAAAEYISAKLRFYIRRSGKKSKSITVEVKPPENTKLPEKKERGIIEDYLHEQGVLLT